MQEISEESLDEQAGGSTGNYEFFKRARKLKEGFTESSLP